MGGAWRQRGAGTKEQSCSVAHNYSDANIASSYRLDSLLSLFLHYSVAFLEIFASVLCAARTLFECEGLLSDRMRPATQSDSDSRF